jgi:hypothetical protein
MLQTVVAWLMQRTGIMTRPWLLAATLIGAVASGTAISNGAAWGIVPLLAFGTVAVLMSRCPHEDATLLPSVRNAGPDRDHARWYCDRCGRTWNADVAIRGSVRQGLGH